VRAKDKHKFPAAKIFGNNVI